jgi:hypothetical protein
MASKLLSLRIRPGTSERLERCARERGEPKSRLAERLIDEGLRMAAHPGVAFRDGPAGRRPALDDGQDIWEVARVIRDVAARGEDVVEGVVKLTGLRPDQVRAVVRYYAEYRDEIDAWIRRVDDEAVAAEGAWLREQELLAR